MLYCKGTSSVLRMPRTKGASDVSEFMRGRIIGQFDRGASQRDISRFLNIPLSTVNRIIVEFKREGKEVNYRPGRPGPTERSKRSLVREVIKNPKQTVEEVAETAQLSKRTIQRYLHSMGLYRRVAKKKPLLTIFQKKRRLAWARDMHSRSENFWSKVIFSDESRYCQFSDSGRLWIWRRSSDKLQEQFLHHTVKYGGISVMVWGAIWKGGRSKLIFCDGIINGEKYIGILKDGLLPLFNKNLRKKEYHFMEDGAPCHKARIVEEFKADKRINILPWAGQSPDMNPIENVWHILQMNLHKRPRKPTSKNDLFAVLIEEWTKIPQDTIDSLISTMPRRVKSLIQSKGGSTKY